MWHCVSGEHVSSMHNADKYNVTGFYFEMWFFMGFWQLWRERFKVLFHVVLYILVRIYQPRKKKNWGSIFKVEARFNIFVHNTGKH